MNKLASYFNNLKTILSSTKLMMDILTMLVLICLIVYSSITLYLARKAPVPSGIFKTDDISGVNVKRSLFYRIFKTNTMWDCLVFLFLFICKVCIEMYKLVDMKNKPIPDKPIPVRQVRKLTKDNLEKDFNYWRALKKCFLLLCLYSWFRLFSIISQTLVNAITELRANTRRDDTETASGLGWEKSGVFSYRKAVSGLRPGLTGSGASSSNNPRDRSQLRIETALNAAAGAEARIQAQAKAKKETEARIQAQAKAKKETEALELTRRGESKLPD